ncbi:MAG TPA: rod shape-determining protein MreD [Tepidisphaeraceae bacterium]|jgi:rod shape-determining protein MreD|nr:rod shape-determining protein MreD [Tepidisphaeraceae bacterium]
MRFAAYFFLTYFMLGLQVGISRYITIHGAAPNLALLAVIYISLNAPRNAALLGSFAIGLTQDLLSAQTPGLYAFSYGLVAMMTVGLHHLVKRTHPITHLTVALIGGLITAFVLLLHSLIHPAAAAFVSEGHGKLSAVRIPAGTEFVRVLYTAAIAPLVLYGLDKIRGVFAFQAQGRAKR